jgi:hypothetical protein
MREICFSVGQEVWKLVRLSPASPLANMFFFSAPPPFMNVRVVSHFSPSSLRRDAKLSSAPSSSLAKAGSLLTKAVGSFVGSSSGSAITQVLHAPLPSAAALSNIAMVAGYVSSSRKRSLAPQNTLFLLRRRLRFYRRASRRLALSRSPRRQGRRLQRKQRTRSARRRRA